MKQFLLHLIAGLKEASYHIDESLCHPLYLELLSIKKGRIRISEQTVINKKSHATYLSDFCEVSKQLLYYESLQSLKRNTHDSVILC